MCSAVEEYAREYAKEKVEEEMAMKSSRFVDTLLKKGFTLSEALEMAEIDEETYNKYKIA